MPWRGVKNRAPHYMLQRNMEQRMAFTKAGSPSAAVRMNGNGHVASGSGFLALTIGSIGGRGLIGVRARDVRARVPGAPGEPVTELRFDRVDVSPDLFALLFRRTSFGFALQAYGSSAKGRAALSSDPKLPGLSSLRLDAPDLDVKSLPLKELAGVEGSGRASLKVDVISLQPADAATGALSLTGRQLGVAGGNLRGFPLPRTLLGDVDAQVTIDKGLARIDRASGGAADDSETIPGHI